MNDVQQPAIALFFDRPYVDAHPCFREMMVSLLARGWGVDLFVEHCATHPLPAVDSPRLCVFPFQKNRLDLAVIIARMASRGWGRYSWIVATPQWALYWAARVGGWIGAPVVCLSDEIFPWDEQRTPAERKWKDREAWAHQRCRLTVSLSENRFEMVKRENALGDDHPHVIVPNAPSGAPARLASSYYRETLRIPVEKLVLLHSGSFQWPLARRLASVAGSWDGRYAVVFQFRYSGASVGAESGGNVYFASNVMPAEMMRYATSSADIGLALYDRENPRDARNSETPGKLGLYLSCCLPVICGNTDSLRWVEEEGCGVWFRDVDEIPVAADRIRANYTRYSENAARIFSERFDYSKFFPKFFTMLEPSLRNRETGS